MKTGHPDAPWVSLWRPLEEAAKASMQSSGKHDDENRGLFHEPEWDEHV